MLLGSGVAHALVAGRGGEAATACYWEKRVCWHLVHARGALPALSLCARRWYRHLWPCQLIQLTFH